LLAAFLFLVGKIKDYLIFLRFTMNSYLEQPAQLDPEWLNSMYNNRALVPDHADYMARWASDSEAARAGSLAELDISYGTSQGEKLDIFRASESQAGNAGAPVLVFIHGGYWRSMDKADHSFLAPAFAQRGACVVIPNYDLCPAVTIPHITLQMVSALAWVYRNIARFGGDPSRITVVGHSAGGHLAAMLLTCLWPLYAKDLPANLVKNALSISGLYELQSIMQTPFLQNSLRLTAKQVAQTSPAWLPAPKKGLLYTVAGASESDEFLRHNALIEQAWGARAVPVREALLGLNHFSVLDALIQPGHRLNSLALSLLAQTA
jgi:arylformamidase